MNGLDAAPAISAGRRAARVLDDPVSLLHLLRMLYARAGRFFRIPLPEFSPYVVAGAEACRDILVTKREALLWHTPDPVADLLRTGLLVSDGEEHDRVRGLLEPFLAPDRLSAYAGMMVRQTDRVSESWQDGTVVDLLVESRKIALLVIMQGLFGADIRDDLPALWTPVLKAVQFISPGPWIFWRRIPRPGFRADLDKLDSYLFRIIAARRAHPAGDDLLHHLLDAGLDDGRIRDQMLTLLIAGHDTSTALLAWTFFLLGTHPEIHARLVRELDLALGGDPPGSPSGWQPALLDEVIKESLRLYPPLHLGSRTVARATQVAGHRIPAGRRLLYSILLTHRDPLSWDRPDEFDPARFSRGRRRPPFAYVPFGGGPRICPGAGFGMAEARLVIARLLQTHRFGPVERDVHVHMGATLEPRPGVFMAASRRKAS